MAISFVIEKKEKISWTWDPLNSNSNILLSNNNLTATALTSAVTLTTISNGFKNTGKWYWEIYLNSILMYESFGFCLADVDFTKTTRSGWNESWAWMTQGRNYHDALYITGLPIMHGHDTLQFAIHIDVGKLWYGINGEWANSGDPENGLNPAREDSTIIGQNVYACATLRYIDKQQTARFLSSDLSYTPPVGFSTIG